MSFASEYEVAGWDPEKEDEAEKRAWPSEAERDEKREEVFEVGKVAKPSLEKALAPADVAAAAASGEYQPPMTPRWE